MADIHLIPKAAPAVQKVVFSRHILLRVWLATQFYTIGNRIMQGGMKVEEHHD